jgi:S-adenosylmethionine hydrolase
MAAVALASGRALYDIGKQLMNINRLIGRQIKTTQNEIEGRILHIDHYGKLGFLTSNWWILDQIGQSRQATIQIGRTTIDGIGNSYYKKEVGRMQLHFSTA